MELLALDKPIKKPPRSDERDGELFYGTSQNLLDIKISTLVYYNSKISIPCENYNSVYIETTHGSVNTNVYDLDNNLIASGINASNPKTIDITNCDCIYLVSAGSSTYSAYFTFKS